MKTNLTVALFLAITVAAFCVGPPAWTDVEGLAVADFRRLGFAFQCDDSMAKHYPKPVVEVAIECPKEILGSATPLEYDAVMIWSDSISTTLAAHPSGGRMRVILTISDSMADSARLAFYFCGPETHATRGVRYIVPLKEVLREWKESQTAQPGATDNPDDAQRLREDH